TSMPELFVSLQAAVQGKFDISLGNVIGSNIANIGLVLGLTALIAPLGIDRDFYKFNWPAMMIASLLLFYFLGTGYEISRLEGGAFVLALVVYLIFMIYRARLHGKAATFEKAVPHLEETSGVKIFFWLLIGAAGLYF